MQVARRVGSSIFGLLFLLGATVQYNDPDPVQWILMYAGAFAACLLDAIGKPQQKLAGLVGAVSLTWALILLPRVLGQLDFGSMFNEVGMATLEIEEGREVLGLLLITAWMTVLFFAKNRAESKRSARE